MKQEKLFNDKLQKSTAKALAKGKAEGGKMRTLEIAKGLDLQTISELTALTHTEIENLR